MMSVVHAHSRALQGEVYWQKGGGESCAKHVDIRMLPPASRSAQKLQPQARMFRMTHGRHTARGGAGWIREAPTQAEWLKEKCRVVLASSSPRRQEILRLLGHWAAFPNLGALRIEPPEVFPSKWSPRSSQRLSLRWPTWL